jgi:hypothetical protein
MSVPRRAKEFGAAVSCSDGPYPFNSRLATTALQANAKSWHRRAAISDAASPHLAARWRQNLIKNRDLSKWPDPLYEGAFHRRRCPEDVFLLGWHEEMRPHRHITDTRL